MGVSRHSLLAALVGFFLSPVSATSWGEGAAPSLGMDPSVRSAGMGSSSTSVFWGDEPNVWGNPGLLGYCQGIRYQHGKTQLIPELAPDVFFTTNRLTFGQGGIGLFLAGKPAGDLGGLRLSYGEWEATSPEGVPLGTYEAWEDINSWGVGVSLAELGENLLHLLHVEAPRVSRFGDVSVGWSSKDVEENLVPASLSDPEVARGKVTAHDRGIVLRATPYNSIDYPGVIPPLDSALGGGWVGARVDVSYGRSMLNYDEPVLILMDPDQRASVSRHSRRGWALHVALGMPVKGREELRRRGLGWLAASVSPFVSWGQAWDRVCLSTRDPDGGERDEGAAIKTSGWELTLFNVYSIRRGQVDDPDGDIHGKADGWSLGFRAADLGGFRYDHASVPRARGMDREEPSGYTVWMDPMRIWKAVRTQDRR